MADPRMNFVMADRGLPPHMSTGYPKLDIALMCFLCTVSAYAFAVWICGCVFLAQDKDVIMSMGLEKVYTFCLGCFIIDNLKYVCYNCIQTAMASRPDDIATIPVYLPLTIFCLLHFPFWIWGAVALFQPYPSVTVPLGSLRLWNFGCILFVHSTLFVFVGFVLSVGMCFGYFRETNAQNMDLFGRDRGMSSVSQAGTTKNPMQEELEKDDEDDDVSAV